MPSPSVMSRERSWSQTVRPSFVIGAVLDPTGEAARSLRRIQPGLVVGMDDLLPEVGIGVPLVGFVAEDRRGLLADRERLLWPVDRIEIGDRRHLLLERAEPFLRLDPPGRGLACPPLTSVSRSASIRSSSIRRRSVTSTIRPRSFVFGRTVAGTSWPTCQSLASPPPFVSKRYSTSSRPPSTAFVQASTTRSRSSGCRRASQNAGSSSHSRGV